MKTSSTFLIALLSIVFGVDGAAQCQKDSCYNAVAVQHKGGPNLNLRKSDCSSVLRKIVTDVTTLIVTATAFPPKAPAPSTSRAASRLILRQEDAEHPQRTSPPVMISGRNILPRDQISVYGKAPNYVNNDCKNVQSYAVACLCFGVKATTQYVRATVVSTTTIIASSTSASTDSSTSTTINSTRSKSTAALTSSTAFDYVSYLQAVGQDFCTSFLDYVPASTTTVVQTRQQIQTMTMSVTTQVTISTTTSTSITYVTATVTVQPPKWKRALKFLEKENRQQSEIQTPYSIIGQPSDSISSYCSSVATGDATTTRTAYQQGVAVQGVTITQSVPVLVTSTSTVTATSTVIRGLPIQLAGSLTSAPSDVYDTSYTVNVPWGLQIFGLQTSSLCVNTNGFINLAACGQYNGGQSYVWMGSLLIQAGSVEGLDYRIDGVAPSRSLTVRWYSVSWNRRDQLFNYTSTFFEDRQGVVLNSYFAIPFLGQQPTIQLTDGQSRIRYNFPTLTLSSGMFVLLDANANSVTSGYL